MMPSDKAIVYRYLSTFVADDSHLTGGDKIGATLLIPRAINFLRKFQFPM